MNLLQKIWLFNSKPEPAPVTIRYHVPRSELRLILRRGLNTLDPQKLPEWACDLAEDVERDEDQPFNIRVGK